MKKLLETLYVTTPDSYLFCRNENICVKIGGEEKASVPAVMLDGNCPIEVVVKKVDEPVIILASADSGAEQTFTDISSLQDSSNPYDPHR